MQLAGIVGPQTAQSVGFKNTQILPPAGPTSAVVAYK